MNDYKNKLLDKLLEKNQFLPVSLAKAWIELLWNDYESTYVKEDTEFEGSEVTEKIVSLWIDSYGDQLHIILAEDPTYKLLLEPDPAKMN